MAREKPRMGTDPLSWIKDTREESKPSKSDIQDKQSIQDLQEKESDKPLTPRAGLRKGWTRATLIVREDHLDKLKSLAWWERRSLKEVTEEALGAYLQGKRIRPIKREEK